MGCPSEYPGVGGGEVEQAVAAVPGLFSGAPPKKTPLIIIAPKVGRHGA